MELNNTIRLKCSTSEHQLADRLQYNPHTIELHLVEKDLMNPYRLRVLVMDLQSRGITVVLHQPFSFNGLLLDINDIEYGRDAYLFQLGLLSALSDELGVYVVQHGNYKFEFGAITKDISDETYRRMENVINCTSDNILWENALWSSFSFDNPYIVEDIIKPLKLNLCFDISHAFISLKGDNSKLLELVKQLDSHVKHYHVVDSMGVHHDSLELGKGLIDFAPLKPFIESESYIFEINLNDQHNCKEMMNSVDYFNKL